MRMKMKKINVQKGSRNEGKRDEKYLKKKRQRTDSIGWQSVLLRLGILLKMETRSERVSWISQVV
jgi:hypothetical protein